MAENREEFNISAETFYSNLIMNDNVIARKEKCITFNISSCSEKTRTYL